MFYQRNLESCRLFRKLKVEKKNVIFSSFSAKISIKTCFSAGRSGPSLIYIVAYTHKRTRVLFISFHTQKIKSAPQKTDHSVFLRLRIFLFGLFFISFPFLPSQWVFIIMWAKLLLPCYGTIELWKRWAKESGYKQASKREWARAWNVKKKMLAIANEN